MQGQRAGEAALPVGGVIGEGDGALAGLPGLKDPVAEALGPAVELVGPLVDLQRHPAAVDEAAPAGNAVGVASHHRPQIAAAPLVAAHVVIAQHHVHLFSGPVRHQKGAQGRAKGDDLRLRRAAAQDEPVHRLSLPGCAEGLLDYCHNGLLLACRNRQVWGIPPVDSIAHPGEKNKGEIRGGHRAGRREGLLGGDGGASPCFFLARRSLPLIFPGFF